MPEPLAQERADGMLGEAHEVLELDERRRSRGGSGAGEERRRRGALGRSAPARPSSVTRSKLHGPLGHERADGEVARVERLQRMADDDALARGAVVRADRAVDHVEQLADRAPPAAAARFVRSSLPV